jgi:hypothetical protein
MPVWEYYSTNKKNSSCHWHPFNEDWAVLVENAWSQGESSVIIIDQKNPDGVRWILYTKLFIQRREAFYGREGWSWTRSIRRKEDIDSNEISQISQAPGKPEEFGEGPGCTFFAFESERG